MGVVITHICTEVPTSFFVPRGGVLVVHIVYYNIKNLSLSRYTSEARSLPAAAYIGTATPHYYMCTEKKMSRVLLKKILHTIPPHTYEGSAA